MSQHNAQWALAIAEDTDILPSCPLHGMQHFFLTNVGPHRSDLTRRLFAGRHETG